MQARSAAKNAKTLDELRTILDNFEGCALKSTASQLVFADGNPEARLMLVGEAPGRDEDIEGLPFVGRSGKLLDRMLAAIGLDRTKVYIANIIPWRPPGNRDPSLHETSICLPFIQRQIELVDPDVLVCLGKPWTADRIEEGLRGGQESEAIRPAVVVRLAVGALLRELQAIRRVVHGPGAALVLTVLGDEQATLERVLVGREADPERVAIAPRERL